MTHTFDMPLNKGAVNLGTLRITYNKNGFMHANYYVPGFTKLPDRLYDSMLNSTLFEPVMEQIKAAIENNKREMEVEEKVS